MGCELAVAWRAGHGCQWRLDELERSPVIYAGFAGVFRSALMAESRSEGLVAGA